MKLFVEPNKNFTEEISYTLAIFAQNKNTKFTFVADQADSELTFGSTSSYDFTIAESFYDLVGQGKFQFDNHFGDDCLIKAGENKPDYLSTAFYMISSLQEYASGDLDDVGRFKYENSYQAKYKNITINLVQNCFDKIGDYPKLRHLSSFQNRSSFFLSHDIDSIHGALAQDGFYLLRNGKPHLVFNLLLNFFLQRPDWFTIDKIMKIEDEYSFRSTFFWLANKGRISRRETNADYNIKSKKIQDAISKIKSSGWSNGIHKSISPDSFQDEINKSGFQPEFNRNHYLKYRLPHLYESIEESGLKLDASLGFAGAFGFRNSYGLPFVPYNLATRKPFSFVEAPLTIMDTTLHKYMNLTPQQAGRQVVEFLETSKYNCLISILWHNNYFTNYKFQGYLDLYKTILAYLYENKWRCSTPKEMATKYSLANPFAIS